MYQKDIVVPEMKYKEFLEKLYEKFSLKETTLSGIDKVTYATLNSSLIDLNRSKIWIVINDESVKKFYKYYYQRFFNKSYVCLDVYKRQDLVHMIFYRTVVSGIEHKNESGVYVEKDSYEAAKKIVQDIV